MTAFEEEKRFSLNHFVKLKFNDYRDDIITWLVKWSNQEDKSVKKHLLLIGYSGFIFNGLIKTNYHSYVYKPKTITTNGKIWLETLGFDKYKHKLIIIEAISLFSFDFLNVKNFLDLIDIQKKIPVIFICDQSVIVTRSIIKKYELFFEIVHTTDKQIHELLNLSSFIREHLFFSKEQLEIEKKSNTIYYRACSLL